MIHYCLLLLEFIQGVFFFRILISWWNFEGWNKWWRTRKPRHLKVKRRISSWKDFCHKKRLETFSFSKWKNKKNLLFQRSNLSYFLFFCNILIVSVRDVCVTEKIPTCRLLIFDQMIKQDPVVWQNRLKQSLSKATNVQFWLTWRYVVVSLSQSTIEVHFETLLLGVSSRFVGTRSCLPRFKTLN